MPKAQAEVISPKKTDAQRQRDAIVSLEKNMQQMVDHINKWVAKIQAIDAVAYTALLLHDGKEIKLDSESVKRNSEQIQIALKEMERYRTEAIKLAEKEEKKTKKAKKSGGRRTDPAQG